jgi:hypothetical protein
MSFPLGLHGKGIKNTEVEVEYGRGELSRRFIAQRDWAEKVE